MAILNKTQILESNDLVTEIVAVPEWGGEVIVRGMSGVDRDKYESTLYKIKGQNVSISLENIRALIVCLSVIDEQGNKLFNLKEVEELGKKSASALEKVANVASRLSGLTQESKEQLKAGIKDSPLESSISSSH